MAVSRNPTLRTTRSIGLAFAALGFLTALLSVFVVASRPWGCSVSSDSPVVSCDWVTSRWVAAAWLVLAVVIGLISLKRWALPLAVISVPLLAFSLISFLGLFTMAPAAFWLGCALWLRSRDSRVWITLSALATVALVFLGLIGVMGLFTLETAPV
jgi:hypothetical protein